MMSGSPIPFETHLDKLREPVRSIMIELRGFVKSVGTNVIEEVRPHRVVYAKTMNFRTFLDVEPAGDSLLLSIRYGRVVPPITATVRSIEDVEDAKKHIIEAYKKIQ